VCYFGMKSIVEKNPHPELLTKANYQALIKSKFSIFDVGKVTAIGKPRVIGSICWISMRDERGLLAFKVELKEVNSHYGYVIENVEEVQSSLFKLRTEGEK
jgi:hypothetical protein